MRVILKQLHAVCHLQGIGESLQLIAIIYHSLYESHALLYASLGNYYS